MFREMECFLRKEFRKYFIQFCFIKNYIWPINKNFMVSTREIIKVQNLVKQYGDFTAVNGISFNVYEGEIFGLLGPNGAGKTTTLEINIGRASCRERV